MPLEVKQGKKSKKNLKGWAVVRVSKENETKDGSPIQQINMIKDWAKRQKKKNGKTYEIVKFIVEDGKSGRYQNTHRRKEILQLVELVRMGSIDFIVQERLDRFSRDEVLNIQIMRDARKNNVEIHEVNYGQFNPNDKGQRMAWKFRNIEAGEYSEGVSENVARKHRSAMVFNGKDPSPRPIWGLDSHPRYVGIYKINRDELEIFEDIANKFIELGYSREGTIRYCNEKGYTTKVWWTKEKIKNGEKIPPKRMGGKPFGWNSLLTLLGSPRIRGRNSFYDNWNQFPDKQDKEGIVVWEYKHFQEHGPLFSEGFFKKIDEGLQKVSYKSRESDFPLSGILFAPNGSKYLGEAAKSGKNAYYYNRKLGKRFCANQIHKSVFSRLKELLKKSDVLKSITSNLGKHPTLGVSRFKNERASIKKKIDNLHGVIEGLDNALKDSALKQKENFTEMLEEILEQKKQCTNDILLFKNKLASLDEKEKNFKVALRGEKFKDYIKLLLSNLKKLDSLEFKSLIRILIPKAIIHLGEAENKLELIYNLDVKTPPVRRTGGMEVFLHGQDGVIPLFPNPSYSEQIKGGGQEDKKWPYIKSGRADWI